MAQWLLPLEYFTGDFNINFPGVELQCILYYLIKKIIDKYVLLLGVLKYFSKTAEGYVFMDFELTMYLLIPHMEVRYESRILCMGTS